MFFDIVVMIPYLVLSTDLGSCVYFFSAFIVAFVSKMLFYILMLFIIWYDIWYGIGSYTMNTLPSLWVLMA